MNTINVINTKLNSLFKKKNKEFNMEKSKWDVANQLLWITPALFFIALFTVYAIFIVFKDGFAAQALADNWTGSFKNFSHVVQDKSFTRSLLNSFLYVIISIPVALLISLLTAKFLSNILNKRMFSFLQSLFFLPYVTSAIAIAMAFSMIFSNDSTGIMSQIFNKIGFKAVDWTKPTNAIVLLLIFGIWRMLPFNILLFTSAFTGVDKKLYQAASIDGMSSYKQFWKIAIPQIMPIIVYTITTGIIGSFKFMPLGLFPSYAAAEASKSQTIVYYIFNNIKSTHNYGKAGAASIILMAIIMGLTICNKFISSSLKKWRK